MLRLCVWVPLPHNALQDEKPDHALTTQSTGQPCTLQGCTLNGAGLGQSPETPSEQVTERVCVPLPHATEQLLHEPVNQLGQGAVLQGCT